MSTNEDIEDNAVIGVAIDRKDTALLVIDIQNGCCHRDGTTARAGIDTSRQQAVVAECRAACTALPLGVTRVG